MRKSLFIFPALLLVTLLLRPSPGAAKDQPVVIGTLADFPSGTVKPFTKEKIIVFSGPQGIYAISTRCTHMGCTVSFKEAEGIFACPCHGARYDKEGAVTRGPAKKNLAWFTVGIDSQGKLFVDKSKVVAQGTKFSCSKDGCAAKP